MVISTWFVLAGVSLLYVALGLWAVCQIFPKTSGTARGQARTDLRDQEENVRK